MYRDRRETDSERQAGKCIHRLINRVSLYTVQCIIINGCYKLTYVEAESVVENNEKQYGEDTVKM